VAECVSKLGRRAVLVCGDLADPDAPERIVSETVERLGGLAVLVNNASIFEETPFEQADAVTWERFFRVNALAPALLAREAAPIMRGGGGGRVINLIDIYVERPLRRFAPYVVSKGALTALTRSLAVELAPEITVNGVAPGIAVFPPDYDEQTRQRLIRRVPLQREGSPEQIARVVRFLAAEGDYITGQVIVVDGGRSIQP